MRQWSGPDSNRQWVFHRRPTTAAMPFDDHSQTAAVLSPAAEPKSCFDIWRLLLPRLAPASRRMMHILSFVVLPSDQTHPDPFLTPCHGKTLSFFCPCLLRVFTLSRAFSRFVSALVSTCHEVVKFFVRGRFCHPWTVSACMPPVARGRVAPWHHPTKSRSSDCYERKTPSRPNCARMFPRQRSFGMQRGPRSLSRNGWPFTRRPLAGLGAGGLRPPRAGQ